MTKVIVNSTKGIVRAFVMSFLILILLSIASTFIDMSAGIRSAAILVTTLLSVLYASIYASKKTGEKGWIHGLLVSAVYMIIIYIVAIAAGRNTVIDLNDLFRVSLALIVGTLSGMLGMNI